MKLLLLSQYSRGATKEQMRLNELLGIPAVTCMFYSKVQSLKSLVNARK